MTDPAVLFADRLDALERRVDELASRGGGDAVVAPLAVESANPADPVDPHGMPAVDPEIFWVVDGLRARIPDPGAVVFGGSIRTVRGPIAWQYGATVDDLMSRDWSVVAANLAALGHPARLAILQNVLAGVTTVTELAEAAELGSTGQAYHHLNQLVAHGWLAPGPGRGHYAIPVPRVVPLLVILTAGAA